MSRRKTWFQQGPYTSSSSRRLEVCAQSKCLPIGLAKICLITSFEPHTRRHFRSQMLLHRFEFTATGVAELPQRVFAVHRAKLYLLSSEIRLRISGHNGFYDLLSLCQNARRRAKSNATQERVSHYQFLRIARIVLQRVDQQPRALRNEIGVQRLAATNLLCQQVAQVLVPRRDPGAHHRTQGTGDRSRNSR